MIRLSGAEAINILDPIFLGKKLAKQDSHTLHFGRIVDGDETIDEVVIGLFLGPNSYTGENILEISCHGSSYILNRVLQLIIAKGARLAGPGEFTQRAYLNGKMDLSQAEAVTDLIASENKATHKMAMQQMRGGYSEEIAKLRQELIDFAALVELELDFGEEDVEFADRPKLIGLIDKIRGVIGALIKSFQLGNVLKKGVNTVIAGRPNAGKSTLLNALLNEERAIVSDIPGTTRDVIEEVLTIDGIAFRLIDTAGIREATDTIEKMGVERTLQKLEQSAITIFVFDLSASSLEDVTADLSNFQSSDVSQIVIGNKKDLVSASELEVYKNIENIHFVSAKDKSDMDSLRKSLTSLVGSGKLNTNQLIVSNARHYEAFTKSDEALAAVKNGLESEISGELVASDIRQALHHLGSITGEISTDDLLSSIFSRFCIGK